ncbi:MAG: LysM peptidoglycan-binding domain-containing protein [Burkholderiales bacterium]|uniref:LysM peptidoglycan-binding domain-containing protein n=1 Tax=Inhella sp. TaxID=1921806 RepID=UPI001AC1D8BF|nr:LysM peptidoglycan-binding domain-containing protein [Burkholderiales bacterium]
MPKPCALPLLAALLLPMQLLQPAGATNFPVTGAQRETMQRVQQAGVPLADLAPDAPERYTVKAGDTLWGISTLFLKSPWRWPELWGMNRDQIANPHLIYPEQILLLVKRDGRAMLQLARQSAGAESVGPGGKLSPRVRSEALADNAVAAIPQHLIEPFLNEAVVLDTAEMATAPRIVAAPEGRVMMTQGDLAYARGTNQPLDGYRVFRSPRALKDPGTGEVLGYEAFYLGAVDLVRRGGQIQQGGDTVEVPFTLSVRQVRQEIGVGDRLAPVPQRAFKRYVPHAPEKAIGGQIVSIYGEALTAGQNQIVALNRGEDDGLERGHVLALWRAGKPARDTTVPRSERVQLPDEQHGVLFVFQTFKRVSYALIISVKDPVSVGDRFSQP